MHVGDQSPVSRPTRALLALLAALVALSGLPAGNAAPVAGTLAQASQGGEEVIVVLDAGADPVAAAQELGVQVTHIYRNVFTGFAGVLPPGGLADARAARSVQSIFPDGEVRAEAQTIPTGVRRSGVPHDSSTGHLTIPSPIDADIAILDTGVARSSDLNVAGGMSCVSDNKEKKDKKKKNKKKKGKKGDKNNKKRNKQKRKKRRNNRGGPSWVDNNGHGTHTAGIAAAIDNEQDVVGVAPGARIWAVKVLDANGVGSFSDVICGLDWVYANQATIDVVNLSLGGAGNDDVCNVNAAPFHQAICNVVDAGVVVVVAAGNQGTDASTRVPAAYDEVITVSGFADSNGAPPPPQGPQGPDTCSGHTDDTFLAFSNFGQDVDIMAPGDCILSLWHTGGLATESGTSEAAPHVAGAAADYIAQQTTTTSVRPTPAETKTWLETLASRPQAVDGVTGDPDAATFPEPVLWLEVLGGP